MPAPPVTDAPVAARATEEVRKRRRWGTSPLYYLGIAVIVVYCLAPFYWMVISALRRPADQFSNSPVPNPMSMDNLRAAFSPGNGFARGLLNSVIVAGTTTVLTLVIGIAAAYALARLDFRGKGFVLPLAIWLLTAFFKQMPFELEEAAQIDGATPAQAFRKVILPLAAPGVFTTAILVFIAAWNEFIIAVSVVNKSEFKTANVIVSQFTGQYQFDQPFGTQMAAGVVVTIPLVIAVLLFQRRIVEGLTAGGVK